MQLNWWVGWGKKEVPPPPCPFAPQLVLTKKLSLGIFYELNQKVRQYSLQGVSSSSFKELFSEMSNAVPISFNLLVGLSHSIVGKKVAFFPFTKIFSRLFAGWFIHPSINYGHVECWWAWQRTDHFLLRHPVSHQALSQHFQHFIQFIWYIFVYLLFKDNEHLEERSCMCLYPHHLAKVSGTWKITQ